MQDSDRCTSTIAQSQPFIPFALHARLRQILRCQPRHATGFWKHRCTPPRLDHGPTASPSDRTKKSPPACLLLSCSAGAALPRDRAPSTSCTARPCSRSALPAAIFLARRLALAYPCSSNAHAYGPIPRTAAAPPQWYRPPPPLELRHTLQRRRGSALQQCRPGCGHLPRAAPRRSCASTVPLQPQQETPFRGTSPPRTPTVATPAPTALSHGSCSSATPPRASTEGMLCIFSFYFLFFSPNDMQMSIQCICS